MRTLFLLPAAMLMISLSACAQSASLDRFYDKFHQSGQSGTDISIDPNFMLTAAFKGKDESTEGSWLKKVTLVRLLVIDEKKAPSAGEWSELSAALHQDHFEDLLSIRKGKDRVQLMSADRQGQKEVVFLAAGETGGGLLLHFKGHFTDKDLQKMQEALQDKQKNQQ